MQLLESANAAACTLYWYSRNTQNNSKQIMHSAAYNIFSIEIVGLWDPSWATPHEIPQAVTPIFVRANKAELQLNATPTQVVLALTKRGHEVTTHQRQFVWPVKASLCAVHSKCMEEPTEKLACTASGLELGELEESNNTEAGSTFIPGADYH